MSATQYKTNEKRDEIPHLLSTLETEQRKPFILTQGELSTLHETGGNKFELITKILSFSPCTCCYGFGPPFFLCHCENVKAPSNPNYIFKHLQVLKHSSSSPSLINLQPTGQNQNFQNVIDKYQEASHCITENFKTSKGSWQTWGLWPSIRITPAISLRLCEKLRTNFRKPK